MKRESVVRATRNPLVRSTGLCLLKEEVVARQRMGSIKPHGRDGVSTAKANDRRILTRYVIIRIGAIKVADTQVCKIKFLIAVRSMWSLPCSRSYITS